MLFLPFNILDFYLFRLNAITIYLVIAIIVVIVMFGLKLQLNFIFFNINIMGSFSVLIIPIK